MWVGSLQNSFDMLTGVRQSCSSVTELVQKNWEITTSGFTSVLYEHFFFLFSVKGIIINEFRRLFSGHWILIVDGSKLNRIIR